ncbi:MAG: CapA family protein [Oscillospiraceae bacterium]|nr:CapA family protein [Oscillospiraceae bacterium]
MSKTHRIIIIIFTAVFMVAVIAGVVIRVSKDDGLEVVSPEVTLVTEDEPEVTAVTEATTEVTTVATTAPTTVSTEAPIEELPEEEEESGEVVIAIGGDTSIDSEFADACYNWGVDYPWKEVSDIFNAADIAIVNLETCVSDTGESEKPEGYGFRTPPEMLEGFVNAGIDIVNLANNHVRDFGYDALLNTFENLESYGIEYFGAGYDEEDAESLVIKEVNGVTIGFAGCNKVYLSSSCAASEDHAGINMVYSMDDERTQDFLAKIAEYDSQVDVLIVFMHCGTEETFEVTSYQEDLGKALIDNGADIVIGGHSHTLQPIEFYNGKPIFYSIGNLIFWHVDDDIDGLTCIFNITVDKDGFKSLTINPLFIKNYKVYLLTEGEGTYASRYRQIIDLMNELCLDYGVQFDDDGVMYFVGDEVEEETDISENAS